MAARLTTHETKAARMLVLYRLREAGLLRGIADADLAKVLHTRRETIWKDRQALARADRLATRMLATSPWAQPPGYTVSEAAERIGCGAETLRYMLRDGMIEADKDKAGRWRIAEAEIDRLRKKERP